MGIDLMNKVDAASHLNGAAKHILLNLARWADDETGLVWPKQATQAERVGCTEETVRTATKQLEVFNDLSCLRTAAKVTLYLVHPCNSLAVRPMLDWSVFEKHLNKGRFIRSARPRIAGWLASLGVLSDAEAVKVLTICHAVKSERKRTRGGVSFQEAQKSWAFAMKHLGLDPNLAIAKPQTFGAEYKEKEIEKNLEGKAENVVGPSKCDNTSRNEPRSGKPLDFGQVREPTIGSIIDQHKNGMTADQLAIEEQRVKDILAGVRRPDRHTFPIQQPNTIDVA